MLSSPQESDYLVYWNIMHACMDTLGFFITELMILWDQVSGVAGMWTVSSLLLCKSVLVSHQLQ